MWTLWQNGLSILFLWEKTNLKGGENLNQWQLFKEKYYNFEVYVSNTTEYLLKMAYFWKIEI